MAEEKTWGRGRGLGDHRKTARIEWMSDFEDSLMWDQESRKCKTQSSKDNSLFLEMIAVVLIYGTGVCFTNVSVGPFFQTPF